MAVNKERIKDNFGILVTLLGSDIVDMATCSGDRLGVECLSRWLTTANGLSRLIGVVVLGTLSTIVTRLSTLETCHNIGAWSSISSGATIGLGRCKLLVGTRRLKGWPRDEPGWQCRAWDPHPALLSSRAG